MSAIVGIAFWAGIIWWFTTGRKSETARVRLGQAKNASLRLVGGWYAVGGIGLIVVTLQRGDAPWYALPLAAALALYGLSVLLGFTQSVWLHPAALLLPLFALAVIAR